MEPVSEFGKILIYLIIGVLLVLSLFGINKWLSNKNDTPQKLSPYECGEENIGDAWFPMSSKFYVIAVIFLFFDVELALVLPWVTIFADKDLMHHNPNWGWFTLTEMVIFISLLILGLLYVWKNGDLNWIIPKKETKIFKTSVPKDLYEAINNKTYIATPLIIIEQVQENIEQKDTIIEKPIAKPGFKPMFRKKES